MYALAMSDQVEYLVLLISLVFTVEMLHVTQEPVPLGIHHRRAIQAELAIGGKFAIVETQTRLRCCSEVPTFRIIVVGEVVALSHELPLRHRHSVAGGKWPAAVGDSEKSGDEGKQQRSL